MALPLPARHPRLQAARRAAIGGAARRGWKANCIYTASDRFALAVADKLNGCLG
jgi:hypothetical protein